MLTCPACQAWIMPCRQPPALKIGVSGLLHLASRISRDMIARLAYLLAGLALGRRMDAKLRQSSLGRPDEIMKSRLIRAGTAGEVELHVGEMRDEKPSWAKLGDGFAVEEPTFVLTSRVYRSHPKPGPQYLVPSQAELWSQFPAIAFHDGWALAGKHSVDQGLLAPSVFLVGNSAFARLMGSPRTELRKGTWGRPPPQRRSGNGSATLGPPAMRQRANRPAKNWDPTDSSGSLAAQRVIVTASL